MSWCNFLASKYDDDTRKITYMLLRVIFEDPSGRQKAWQRVGKYVAKPSGPSGRNDGSQVHEINKWALRR